MREVERARGQLTATLGALSGGQLAALTESIAGAAAEAADRPALVHVRQTRALLAEHGPALGGAARSRLEAALEGAEGRVREAEEAERAARETPVQAAVREALVVKMHRLSQMFAASDANGDGQVNRLEFRRVLPLLGVAEATDADADEVFYGFAHGDESLDYRQLLRELSEIREIQRAKAAAPSLPPPRSSPAPSSRPSSRSIGPSAKPPQRRSAADELAKMRASNNSKGGASEGGPPPRAASAAKERPASAGPKPRGPPLKGSPSKPGSKKPAARGAPRSTSAPRASAGGLGGGLA